jgi:hypothetical protein
MQENRMVFMVQGEKVSGPSRVALTASVNLEPQRRRHKRRLDLGRPARLSAH